jgi:hypothetical protein
MEAGKFIHLLVDPEDKIEAIIVAMPLHLAFVLLPELFEVF